MTARTPAVWWLTGPPCAGKSAASWELFSSVLAGRPRSHVDVDQLGMTYPEPHDDDARQALKARAAAVVVRHHVARGAEVVVVSGVLGPGGDATVRQALGDLGAASCRVRADEGVLRVRLAQRYDDDAVQRALADARRWDASDLPALDTTSCGAREAARQAADLFQAAPPSPARAVATLTADPAADPAAGAATSRGGALLVCGPPASGASTAGFGLAARSWARGETCTYLDGHQLSFTADLPVPSAAGAVAALVGDLWRTCRAAGSETLVVRADVRSPRDVEAFRTALAGTPLLAVRLAADEVALRQRTAARARGAGPHLAGDALRGLSAGEQRSAVAESLARQDELQRQRVGDAVVDTSALDPGGVVEHLAALAALRDDRGNEPVGLP